MAKTIKSRVSVENAENDREENENVFKILLIGDSGVGKSGLLLRFTEDAFKESYHTTIGADLKRRTIEIDGKQVKLEIWDTSGQERFRSITTNYYRKTHGIMIVYDITNMTSYTNLEVWMEEIARHTSSNVSKILVGNKSDLSGEKKVSTETTKKYADILGIPFIQTSVKYSIDVDTAFEVLASDIMMNTNTKTVILQDELVRLPETVATKRLKECCNV